MVRLNMGCGATPLPGYINIDRNPPDGADVVKGEVYPLAAYADDSVDEIRASHVLEHFGHRQVLDVLKEWARVLKPAGLLKLAVPDFDWIVNAYVTGTNAPVESYLMGGQVDANDHHGVIFSEQRLRDMLRAVGIIGIRRWESDAADCSASPCSLNLLGHKRSFVAVQDMRCIMSMPRLCFTDQFTCHTALLSRMKLPTRIRQGVFWGQTMTMAMEECIAEGAKYILAVDYDSVYTPEHVEELYRLMVDNPQADAICPMQIGRERETALLTIRGSDGKNTDRVAAAAMNEDLLKLSTGHFGLTIIRVEAIEALSKPWFIHQPGPDSRWGEGRIDEDIYFWRNMEAAGRTLYQANHVRIGHMQLMCTWPRRDMSPFHQYMSDCRKNGIPEEIK